MCLEGKLHRMRHNFNQDQKIQLKTVKMALILDCIKKNTKVPTVSLAIAKYREVYNTFTLHKSIGL